MIFQCAICDDEPTVAHATKSKVDDILSKLDISYRISIYTNSKQLLFEMDGCNQFDLLIIDIEMPEVSGLKIAEIANKYYKNSLVILLTSHLNYAIEGYEMNVFRFIPKEQTDERLERYVVDAVKMITNVLQKSYVVKRHDLVEKVFYNDIFYITKDGKNSILHLGNRDSIRVRKPLAVVLQELNSEEFVYIDRGCIANMSNLHRLHNREWLCENGEMLMMSTAAYSTIKPKLLEFWSKSIVE